MIYLHHKSWKMTAVLGITCVQVLTLGQCRGKGEDAPPVL